MDMFVCITSRFSKRRSGIISLLLLLGSFGMTVAGCNKNSDSQFAGSGFSAPSLGQEVPAAVRADAQRRVEQFVSDIQKKDYAAARKTMSPALRAKTPATLDEWLKTGQYQSLFGATNWKFDLTNYSSGGKKLVVHTGFSGADKGTYRTNFILSQNGTSWDVDTVLPITKQVLPSKPRSVGTSALPGR